MIPDTLNKILSCDPDTLGGSVCFRGTRIPVRILFDYVDNGSSLSEFLAQYPSLKEADALQVLKWQREAALEILEPRKAS